MPVSSDGRIGPVTNRKTEWELSPLNDRDIVLIRAMFEGMVIKRHIQPDIRSVFISING